MNGSRFWVQRVTIRGKRREIGLGSAGLVSLAEAREQAITNKRLIRAGGDPLIEKRKARRALTFEEAAHKTHAELKSTWKNPKDRAAFLSSLERHIFPRFGSMLVSDVTSADIRRAVLDVRKSAPHVARKLVHRVSAVMKWAIAEGLRTDNPAVADALALPRLVECRNHRKALPYTEVAQCLDAVQRSGAMASTKLAFAFLVLTAARSGEVRNAKWEEIDLQGAKSLSEATEAVWVVPKERMKMKRVHRVPLSPQALEILKAAQELDDGSGLIFPGARPGRPMSDMTLSKLLRELGFDAHVHGFRTSFRTWTQEQTDYPREVAEAALAHRIGDIVEASYARSDLFEKRRRMMIDWAGYLADGERNADHRNEK